MKRTKDSMFMPVFSILALLVATGSFAGGGSTGTTGGGFTNFDVYALLPRSLAFVETYAPYCGIRPIPIAKKRYWGIVPGTVYAWEFVVNREFDLEVFKARQKWARVRVVGRDGKYEKELTSADLAGSKESDGDIETELRRYDFGRLKSAKMLWEKQDVSPKAFYARNKKIFEAVKAQIDFDHPETLRNAKVAADYFRLTGGFNDEGFGSLQEEVYERLSALVLKEANDIFADAHKIVDETTSTCDQVKYVQVKTRILAFKIGRTKWIENLSAASGLDLKAMLPELVRLRSRIHQFIAEDVEPYCAMPAGRPALQETGDGNVAPIEVQ